MVYIICYFRSLLKLGSFSETDIAGRWTAWASQTLRTRALIPCTAQLPVRPKILGIHLNPAGLCWGSWFAWVSMHSGCTHQVLLKHWKQWSLGNTTHSLLKYIFMWIIVTYSTMICWSIDHREVFKVPCPIHHHTCILFGGQSQHSNCFQSVLLLWKNIITSFAGLFNTASTTQRQKNATFAGPIHLASYGPIPIHSWGQGFANAKHLEQAFFKHRVFF